MTFLGDKEIDYKIERKCNKNFEITNLTTPEAKTKTVCIKDFTIDYGTLVRFNMDGTNKLC